MSAVRARLEAHVRALTVLQPRDASHPERLDRAANYIAGAFRELGAEPREQRFEVSGRTYRNVCVRVAPDGARSASAESVQAAGRDLVVVGAHYDAVRGTPGADDNASGVAGLIELARRLLDEPRPWRREVELVAFSLEEPPHFGSDAMGSAVHAQSLVRAGTRVHAMISLEMIGYFSDAPESQAFPMPELRQRYPSVGNFIAVAGDLANRELVTMVERAMREAGDLPVYSISAPASVPGISLSDHLSYWAAGFRAVMITDTAFYRNPGYHTEQDTAARLDYGRMAKVVDGVANAVRALAT